METMQVLSFHGQKVLPGLEEYPHKVKFPFSKEIRNDIIDDIMDAGYNVLLQKSGDTLFIWVDKYRFQQR